MTNLDKVLTETANELGCQPDNEEILRAIDALKKERAKMIGVAIHAVRAAERLSAASNKKEADDATEAITELSRQDLSASLAAHDAEVFQREVKVVYRQWADDSVGWDAPQVFRALHIRLESMMEDVEAFKRGGV